MLGVVLVLMVLKGPWLLTHPRLWAEDALYLNFALTHNMWDSFIYSKPSVGYYLLTANVLIILAATASKAFGLVYAPTVITYFSFLIQFIPFFVLLYGKSHLFRNRLLVIVGCILILLAPTTGGEVWLSTIHTKSWTGLAAFILLFEDVSEWSKRKVWLFRVFVLFLGLSGPYAAILSPIFFLSSFLYKEREKAFYAAILGGCCLLHLAVAIHEIQDGTMAMRTDSYTPDSAIVNVFVFQVAWAFLGEHTLAFCNSRLGLADSIHKSMAVPRIGSVVLAAWFCALTTLLYLRTFWTRLRSEQAILVATFLLMAVFTARTALDGIPYSRYALLPGLALLLLLLDQWNGGYSWKRFPAAVLLACSVFSGIRDYQSFWIRYSAGQPSWPSEVEKWRKDRDYSPAVWPSSWPGHLDWHPEHRK